MTDLNALASRVEGLSGPNYEIDCEVWDAIYPGERATRFSNFIAPGKPHHRRLGPADMDGYVKPLRSFTASLDAAMTLVPEGWTYVHVEICARGREGQHCNAEISRFSDADEQEHRVMGYAATPALALVAAALRARAKGRGE